MIRIVLIFSILILSYSIGLAQDTLARVIDTQAIPDTTQSGKAYLILQEVILEGNQQTKERIILRELDIKVGDSLRLAKLDTILKRNRNKIFNTNLFVTVDLFLELLPPESARLRIKMQERWYIFPVPIFELSDRNFNEWWNTYNHDLSRTNYGMRVNWDNFRGRKEKLSIQAQFGFVKRFGINYEIPYLDRQQKHGLHIGFSYAQNKSVAYRTIDHKLAFLKSSSENLRERVEAYISLTKRNAYYTFHRLNLGFRHTWVADTLLQANPDYFLNNKTTQSYFTLSYQFRRDLRDIFAYPLHGSLWLFNFEKNGLGLFRDLEAINFTRFSLTYAQYKELGKGFFLENLAKGSYLWQSKQPYANAQAMGYNENILRGYELYVIDGQSFVFSKSTLKYQLFNVKRKLKSMPIKQFRTIPMALYLTTYWDMGYVKDAYFTDYSNRFSNQFIYGYGAGLNFFTYYNLVIRANYSFNQTGKGGFFLNFSANL